MYNKGPNFPASDQSNVKIKHSFTNQSIDQLNSTQKVPTSLIREQNRKHNVGTYTISAMIFRTSTRIHRGMLNDRWAAEEDTPLSGGALKMALMG